MLVTRYSSNTDYKFVITCFKQFRPVEKYFINIIVSLAVGSKLVILNILIQGTSLSCNGHNCNLLAITFLLNIQNKLLTTDL